MLLEVKQQCHTPSQDVHCSWRASYKKGLSLRTVASATFMNVKIQPGQIFFSGFSVFFRCFLIFCSLWGLLKRSLKCLLSVLNTGSELQLRLCAKTRKQVVTQFSDARLKVHAVMNK